MTRQPVVALSPLDEERFGMRTGRVFVPAAEDLPQIMDECCRQEIVMLVARCPADDFRAIQAMERKGFLLMETSMRYDRNLLRRPIAPDDAKALLRPFRRGEEEEVMEIARATFGDYFGHYHADERLDRDKCADAYVDWARRSCLSRTPDEEVLVAEHGGSLIGFLTMKLNAGDEGQPVLGGTIPAVQKLGIFGSLMTRGLEWAKARGAVRMMASVHVSNVAIQKVLLRVGYEPAGGFHTFHKWFDREPGVTNGAQALHRRRSARNRRASRAGSG
jgi:RimJ/RimL family protein N-acetyltransferase